MENAPPRPDLTRSAGVVLLVAIFLLAISGLVYELIAGTLSSYLLGDSVTQFSIVIGVFLTAMGVGSFLSKYITEDLLGRFILIELGVGVIGGATALIGFATFAYTSLYVPVLISLVVLVGILVGLEIPLVVRILKDLSSLRVTLANVLSADYLGALAASVLFPFAMLPHLGLVQAGLVAGLTNVAVAGLLLWRFEKAIGRGLRKLQVALVAGGLLLIASLVFSNSLVSHFESRVYQDEIIHAQSSAHQRIILTRWRDDIRLYLNGHLQFSTVDEYRYHESLVHPAMSVAEKPANVLILGGGDGLAAKQVATYKDVEQITIVDIDPAVTELFTTKDMLSSINGNVFSDARVRVVHQDAFIFLEHSDDIFDVILMDLPDPSDPSLGKLYSNVFYNLAAKRLAPGGAIAVQSTSPYRSREAFWCIVQTIESVRFGLESGTPLHVLPYHTYIPTFGTWGFTLAAKQPVSPDGMDIPSNLKFLTPQVVRAMFVFPPDMARIPQPVSTLNDSIVVHRYRAGYHKYLD